MRKILPGLAVFMLLGISGSVAFSYLSEKNDVVHQISVTDTRIAIEESTISEKLLPGYDINREVRVRNLSESSCFVRVACFFSDDKSEKICERISVREGWEQKEDGYYYWKKELLPGEATEALFDNIVIKTGIPEEEMKSLELFFYAEAAGVSGSKELSWERIK